MNRQSLLKLSFIVMMLLPLIGCWDMEEIEDRNQVIAMAIDRVGKSHEVTVQVPIPPNIVGGSSGTGGGRAFETFSARGNSLTEITYKLQKSINRRLFFGHLQLVIFGGGEAKYGVNPFLDLLMRNPDVNRKLYVITTPGRANELLTQSIEIEKINSQFINNMIRTGITFQRMVSTTLVKLVSDIKNIHNNSPILNELVATSKGYRWIGISLFQHDRRIGMLPADEANALLHIREESVGNPLSVPCSKRDGNIEFRPIDVKRTIAIRQNSVVRITVEVEGEIVEKTCGVDLSDPKETKLIQNRVRKKYYRLARKVINRAQRQYRTDIFELGNHLHAFHPVFYRNHIWKKAFPQLPIQIDYHVHIRRFGLDT